MMRRYARWVAITLLLGGCGDSPRTQTLAITEYNKGGHFAEREDWDTAIACYTEAIRLNPDFAAAYNNRGFAYLKNDEIEQAIKDLSEAIRLKPDFAIFLNPDEYEGGDVRFPEFGSKTYRATTGGAVVFSCSLLHEVLPMIRGRRFAFLPFLYDDAAAELRDANLRFLEE